MDSLKILTSREKAKCERLLHTLRTQSLVVVYRDDISSPADGTSKEAELPLLYAYLEELSTGDAPVARYYLSINNRILDSQLSKCLNKYSASYARVRMDMLTAIALLGRKLCDAEIEKAGKMPSELWAEPTSLTYVVVKN